MKLQVRQFQRLVFLTLLCVCVVAPILLVSTNLKFISSIIGQQDFIEDVSSIKDTRDGVELNAVEQEQGGNFKEPKLVVYQDNASNLNVSYSSSIENDSEKIEDDGKTMGFNEINGTSGEREKIHQQPEISSTFSGKRVKTSVQARSNQTIHLRHDVLARPQRTTDEKVKEMKDQIIRCRVYLNLAPPGSNSHLVKELRLRIKELERAMGEATKDSELSRNALQKSRAMESTLSKANLVYPDCSAMVTELHAMADIAEEQVKAEKNQVAHLFQLAAGTIPKGFHCLSMRLTAEYFALRPEDRQFPNQQKISDPILYHYVVFSDNVIAAGVVVNSTVYTAAEPENVVFHVVTDSLNLIAMSMWFLLNPPGNATIQVQSIDKFEWVSKNNLKLQENPHEPRYSPALNHLWFYLPDLFPELHKVVVFDHDVVIQRDLTALWKTNMKGKVVGVVETCNEGEHSFHEIDMFINFSHPFVADKFDAKACTWAFGMNLFDLEEWRRQNLTALYHQYLHLGYNHPLLKGDGRLPLGWLTFYNQTMALDKRWHVQGLGYESGIEQSNIERGAVIHYDGLMKPWMEIGIGKYKSYWNKHVNFYHPVLLQCNIHE